MAAPNQKIAIAKINQNGALLVFPLNNKQEPKSLWSEFHPRTKMRWEWNESGDDRVGQLWLLMKKLSDCREVVYSKWYQGRATFFSRELFTAMLAAKMAINENADGLTASARQLYEALESDSPLSTKVLKQVTDLQGKANESTYNRGLRELFRRLLIVGFGEVDDGAFPSLAVGATKNLYEEIWDEALAMPQAEAQTTINKWMPADSVFGKFWLKTY